MDLDCWGRLAENRGEYSAATKRCSQSDIPNGGRGCGPTETTEVAREQRPMAIAMGLLFVVVGSIQS
jgi:hypothetical protein